MARSGISWKEAGLDKSPPRPRPNNPRVLAEIYVGRMTVLLNRWKDEGRLQDAERLGDWIREGVTLFSRKRP